MLRHAVALLIRTQPAAAAPMKPGRRGRCCKRRPAHFCTTCGLSCLDCVWPTIFIIWALMIYAAGHVSTGGWTLPVFES